MKIQEIENKIAENKMTAAQVYTQMLQHIRSPINIIIDDSDSQNPIFIEIENDRGHSIRTGEELRAKEGCRKIRI